MVDPQENSPQDIPDYDGIEDEAFPHSHHHTPQAGEARRKETLLQMVDAAVLISDRGLPALGTLFDNIQFKGKGHEAADLRLLMQKMENWAHRLYPKLQFEDFIDKTCLKRIRLDMPLTHEDFTSTDVSSPDIRILSADCRSPRSPPTPSLTEEQQKRIELNRQRALEKRRARQQQIGKNDETVEDPDLEPSNNTSTQQTSPLPPKTLSPLRLRPASALSNSSATTV
uniref:TIMELESS-interacting protein n=1 Tax=Maylandia zebra TaxID=106582 RepID=A0A3P9CEB4_9CICH